MSKLPLSLNINELLYYNKPSIGNDNDNDNNDNQSRLPKELIYPNGKIQIGINVTNIDGNNGAGANSHDNNMVVVSGPENFDEDYNIKDYLVIIICCLCILNMIITSSMFHNLNIIDLSAVMKAQGIYIYICYLLLYIYCYETKF